MGLGQYVASPVFPVEQCFIIGYDIPQELLASLQATLLVPLPSCLVYHIAGHTAVNGHGDFSSS